MCQTRNSRRVKIGIRTVRIDGCIAELVQTLNDVGLETVACCCGHGRYPRTILIRINGLILDICNGKIIPRSRNFYRMDEEGYFYLPEAT